MKLHNTLDAQCSKLHAEGIGANVTQASIISYEDEAQLMHCNVMSYANPKSLLNLEFFYTGLHCSLSEVVKSNVICLGCSLSDFLKIEVSKTKTLAMFIPSSYLTIISIGLKTCIQRTKQSKIILCPNL